MRVHTRLGVCFCFSIFSLILFVWAVSRYRSEGIVLSSLTDKIPHFRWKSKGIKLHVDNETRLVVFGDSWVDDKHGISMRGESWVDVLCETVHCTSIQNLAVSQPAGSYPALEATGAVLSNSILFPDNTNITTSSNILPDLAAQVQQFLALSPNEPCSPKTIFIISFGLWDIYHLAGLDPTKAQSMVDASLASLFAQLNILHGHYNATLPETSGANSPIPISLNAPDLTRRGGILPPFRVIIPKLFDPTLLPGWLSQRPAPLAPSSIAEHQKHAIALAERWNNVLADKIGTWLQEGPLPNPDTQDDKARMPPKEVLFYDLPQYVLDLLIEQNLEDEGLTDAEGLGTGQSPFLSVYQPCVGNPALGADVDHPQEFEGQLVCKQASRHLFFDDFHLGEVANREVGTEIAALVEADAWERRADL